MILTFLLIATPLSEENRLATFVDWPFDSEDGAKCTSEKMARAGWYHPGSNNEPDLARYLETTGLVAY